MRVQRQPRSSPPSAVITRDWTVESNLSLGTETYVPARLLHGLLPYALLESHAFWQDEDDQFYYYNLDTGEVTRESPPTTWRVAQDAESKAFYYFNLVSN